MTPTRLGCFALLALLAGLLISCNNKGPGPDPLHPIAAQPDARFVQVCAQSSHSVTMRWNDRSDDEDGFFIYLRDGIDTLWTRVDTVGRNVGQVRIDSWCSLQRIYHFHVTAYNENGESDPSDDLEVTTVGVAPPAAPHRPRGAMVGERVVRVSWQDSVAVDSFLIERRTAAEVWQPLGVTLGDIYLFHDSLVAVETQYYYRVGAAGEGGLAWSADSVAIVTPLAGVPLPPDSLTATAVLGLGVRVDWLDRSMNESGFAIGRSLVGHIPAVIDSVAADVVSYFDSLGADMDRYNYYVRAFNDTGTSAWCARATIDYRYCSPGLIPLCLDNAWKYFVDSSGAQSYSLNRKVLNYAFVDSIDYYLIGQYKGDSDPIDSLHYLRNNDNLGTLILRHPLGIAPDPQLLFRYPPNQAFWFALGDCVIVTNPNTSVVLTNGTVYDHVVGYQRFFAGQHSIQYFIKPGIGIVREDEWLNGNRTRRDLTQVVLYN